MIRWTTAFIDRPMDRFDASATFWSTVTGTTVSPRRGQRDEFATLLPDRADPYLRLQGVDGAAGAHLDLDVVDVEACTRTATGLGAEVVWPHADWGVLRSPGGLLFCIGPDEGRRRRPAPVTGPDGTSSRLDQVSIDVAPAAYDAEVAFWAKLTGWDLRQSALPEFQVLRSPSSLPVRILMQRLASDQPTSAHVDVACADRDATSRWHVSLGATEVARRQRWTVMRDPAGGTYCLTGRDPDTGDSPS